MNDMKKSLYLNQEIVKKDERSGFRRALAGGILLLLSSSSYIRMFLEVGADSLSDAANIAGTMMFLMVVALILLSEYLLFISGYRRLKYSRLARRCADLFAQEERIPLRLC